MSKEELTDLKALKEWALGTEFDREKGFNYKFNTHCLETNKRLCLIENRLKHRKEKNVCRWFKIININVC